MIRSIEPLQSPGDFSKLNETLFHFVNEKDSLKFLNYTLIRFDKAKIEEQTLKHKDNGIDYLVYEENEIITGILVYKRDIIMGFELFMLVVDKKNQRKGIGKKLVDECINIAKDEKYDSIETSVFADNEGMLKLLENKDFVRVNIIHHARVDGADLITLRKYLE